MADDEVVEPQAGELTTANYGWTKPTVGASDDAWGGYLNSDLDGIDTTVKSVSTVANAAYPATNPSGYQTAAQVTAALPVVTTTTPAMDGTAAIGSTGKWADGGHIHPTDTSRYAASNPSNYITAATLPIASTTVLGGVKVDGTTIKAAGDGTISTTVLPMNDNRIINGDMRIDQRGVASGAGGTAVGYTVDRWLFSATLATKGSWLRANFGALGFPYALAFSSNSAYTPLAGDTFCFIQPIEADMISDFQWGTAQAQPVTLSFVVLSTLTGTFSGAIQNAANTRSYPFTYSIPTASAATKISITVPGDTTGAWVLSGNVRSLSVIFDLGTGATYRAPAGAWAGAQYNGANGAVNVVATNGATFYLTGVKLEVGSVATPFNRQSLAKSMADCQRYYQTTATFFSGNTTNAAAYYAIANLQVQMRSTPTVVWANNGSNGFPTTSTTFAVALNYVVETRTSNATTTGGNFQGIAQLSAEL